MPGSRDQLLNFGTPLISLERLKIQTSNFACGLKERDTKPQNEKWVKRGRGLSHVTYFSNFGTPPLISPEQLMIQTSNFACGLKVIGQKGAWPRLRDLLFKFRDPPDISGTAEDANLKFSVQIDLKRY